MIKKDEFVSVLLLAEDTGEEHTIAAIENVLAQTHRKFEILVTTLFDFANLKEKYKDNFKISFAEAKPGAEYLNEALDKCNSKVIFYKTVTNVLWQPRHMQLHLEEYVQNRDAKWSLSHIEYRDIDNADHPLNTIGYRIDSPPPFERIILDEISHLYDIDVDWTVCLNKLENGNFDFLPGNILYKWNEKKYKGVMPNEIGVVQWIKFQTPDQEQHSFEDLAKSLGVPKSTDVKEENKMIDGNIEVMRMLPTIMGNAHLDEYNNSIREVARNTEDIKDIGLKRTIGMGDIILTEPIIKKLKDKYEDAKITFYTNKPDVVKYFKHKPDNIVEIDESELTNDLLADKHHQLSFDLDLSYESRPGFSFVDAYAQVCNIEWDDYKDRYVQFDGTFSTELENYVVVVGDGSGWPGKTWGQQNYKEVVQNLLDKNYNVVEPGFSDFSGLTDEKWNQCEFSQLVNLIACCEFYVGTDNGPMHIARALNKPCIIIAGAALPYYSNPNREGVYYVQDNSLECLGCKHKQFFSTNNSNQITFVPGCEQEEQGLCMKTIKPEHVISALDKFLDTPKSLFSNNNTKFYMNIPGWSYYIDKNMDLIQRGDVDAHPDQMDDLHVQYSSRWEEVFEKYSVPFVEEVKKHKETGTFLDIGCNIGLVVKAAIEAGFDGYGTDINSASIRKGLELFEKLENKIVHPDYFEKEGTTSKWDIITCNQTLEHISDPIDFIHNLKGKLADEGLLFIGVPSLDETDGRNKMHKWQTVGTGEHTVLFTNKSFDWLMNECDLEYEHLQDTSQGIFVKAWRT